MREKGARRHDLGINGVRDASFDGVVEFWAALLMSKGFNKILYRCMFCGQQLKASDLEGKQAWQR